MKKTDAIKALRELVYTLEHSGELIEDVDITVRFHDVSTRPQLKQCLELADDRDAITDIHHGGGAYGSASFAICGCTAVAFYRRSLLAVMTNEMVPKVVRIQSRDLLESQNGKEPQQDVGTDAAGVQEVAK